MRLEILPAPGREARKRKLYGTIETPNANDIGHLRIEGGRNAASPQPLIFTFSGTSGIRENDRVRFAGTTYVLLNALPQTYAGVVVAVRCVGVRVSSEG